MEKTLITLKERITVTGYSVSGEDEKKKVTLTFKFTEDNKQVKGGSTHPITLSTSEYGYEEELEQTIKDIQDEVYEYLFNGKSAQLSAFDEQINAAISVTENVAV